LYSKVIKSEEVEMLREVGLFEVTIDRNIDLDLVSTHQHR